MACAIWGRARFTAGGTLASSGLMMRAISSDDLRSRSVEAEFVFSVSRRRSSARVSRPIEFRRIEFAGVETLRFEASRFNGSSPSIQPPHREAPDELA